MTFYDAIKRAIDPAAASLGKRGGQAKSPAKTAAARANGAKGGRPKKNCSGSASA